MTSNNEKYGNDKSNMSGLPQRIFNGIRACFIVLLSGLSLPLSAQFFIEESCKNASGIFEPHGNAYYTAGRGIDAEGQGWLRLTETKVGDMGYVLLNSTFPSSMGAVVEFDFKIWADKINESLADGFSVFLFDGNSDSTFKIGAAGGSLGYIKMRPAYLGVGIDEYGGFSQNKNIPGVIENDLSPHKDVVQNSIAIRNAAYVYQAGTKSGLGLTPYTALGHTLAVTARPPDATIYRRVKISLEPLTIGMSVTVALKKELNGSYINILGPVNVIQPTPSLLRVGFAACTGAYYAFHEVRNVSIHTLGTLSVFKSINDCERTKDNTIISTHITNNTSDQVDNIIVSDTMPVGYIVTSRTAEGAPSGSYSLLSSSTTGDGRQVLRSKISASANSTLRILYHGHFATIPANGQYTTSAFIEPPSDFNDTNLDDNYVSITGKIIEKPVVPTVTVTESCIGQNPVITLTGEARVTYKVYATSSGGDPIGASLGADSTIDITINDMITSTSAKTYYVEASRITESGNTCASSSRTGIQVTPKSAPSPLDGDYVSVARVCAGTPPTIEIGNTSSGLTYQVYNFFNGVSLGELVGSKTCTNGEDLEILCTGNLSTSTTYYVRAYNGNCYSLVLPVSIRVVEPPTVPELSVCVGTVPEITVTNSAAGWTYKVYNKSGVVVGSMMSPGETIKIKCGTYVFTADDALSVRAFNPDESCSTGATPVPIIIANPTVPELSSTEICVGQNPIITLTGETGVTYSIYDAITNGNKVSADVQGTGTTIDITVNDTPSASRFYYVEALKTVSSCPSVPRKEIKVEIKCAVKRYVTQSGKGAKNGSSWNDASDNLQAMINASGIDEEVWVATGTYKPVYKANDHSQVVDPNDDHSDNAFVLKKGVKIYGGFANNLTGTNGSVAARAIKQDGQMQNTSILSGEFGDESVDDDNCNHVVIGIDSLDGVVLDGFTIMAGGAVNGDICTGDCTPESIKVNGVDVHSCKGGGIYLYSGNSVPVPVPSINNTVITKNVSLNGGAGIYNNSSLELNNVQIIKNYTLFSGGSGIYNDSGGSLKLNNVLISENIPYGPPCSGHYEDLDSNGGGIFNKGSFEFNNGQIIENLADGSGGGIFNASGSGSSKLTNVQITSNTTVFNGGGISNAPSSGSSKLTNVKIARNIAERGYGGGIFNASPDTVKLINVQITNNVVEHGDGGGGMYNNEISNTKSLLINVTVANNSAYNGEGGGIYFPTSITQHKVYNSIIYGNTATTYMNVKNSDASIYTKSLVEGESIINDINIISSGDPLFVAPSPSDCPVSCPDGDYQLSVGSPAVDVGDNKSYTQNTTITTDLAGNPRLNGSIDLGAFELLCDGSTPVLPADISAVTACTNTTPTIKITNTNSALTYKVYDNYNQVVGTGTGNGGDLYIPCTSTLTSSTTYFVRTYNGVNSNPCYSTATPVSITIITKPSGSINASAETICSDSIPRIKITNTISGMTYRVYNSSGVEVGSMTSNGGTMYIDCSNPVTESGTYTVKKCDGECCSDPKTVTITVSPKPTVPELTTFAICNGQKPTIGLTGESGVIYNVYASDVGGNSIGTGSGTGQINIVVNDTSATGTKSYYVEALSSTGCLSESRKKITVTIKLTPANPISTNISASAICSGTTPTITIAKTTKGMTYRVHDNSDGSGTLVGEGTSTGTNQTIDIACSSPLTANTEYSVTTYNGVCNSLSAVTVLITVKSTPELSASNITVTNGAGGTGSIKIDLAGVDMYSIDNGGHWSKTSTFNNQSVGDYIVRVKKESDDCPSNPVTVTLSSALSAGTIGSDQTICSGTAPLGLTSTAPASGVTGTISYQWQKSTTPNDWADISSGGTSATYSPGSLTETTYYRRKAYTSTDTAYSNEVIITVYPDLTSGSINGTQTICYGGQPSILDNVTYANGGDSNLSYLWKQRQSKTSVWIDAEGDNTKASYTPPVLTYTTYYRRYVTSGSNCGTITSDSVTVTVLPHALANDIIAGDMVICSGSKAMLTLNSDITDAEYKWYRQQNDDAPFHTGNAYVTSTLTADTTFYLSVLSDNYCENTKDSRKPVTVKVYNSPGHSDLRIRVCPQINSINLSQYIDSAYVTSLVWTGSGIDSDGYVSPSIYGTSGQFTFIYTISDLCGSNYIRKAYIEITENDKIPTLEDTVLPICYDQADAIQINQIFGIEANGTWEYYANSKNDLNGKTHIAVSTSLPYTGSIVMNGKAIYDDSSITAYPYLGDSNAKKVVFIYKTNSASCLNGKEYKVTIVIYKN
ncbi:MAG: hypothetical protein LBS55_09785 [Prevotellaceae bacterium]|jgi:hypothetical protein|nr:hypothetical protein [Prevotellaceae bacterium]